MKNRAATFFCRIWKTCFPRNQTAPFGERIYANVSVMMVGLMFVCRGISLCPVVIKRIVCTKTGKTTWKIAYSWPWNVFNSVFSVFYVGYSIYGILKSISLMSTRDGKYSSTYMYLVMINASILTVFCSVGIIRCGAHVKDLVSALRLIEKADILVSWAPHERKISKKFRVVTCILIVYWIFLLVIKIYRGPQALDRNRFLYDESDSNIYITMYFTLYMYGVLTIILLSSYVYILKEKLDIVNDTLKLLGRDMNSPKWIYGKSGVICVKSEMKEISSYSIQECDNLSVKSTPYIGSKNKVTLMTTSHINFDYGDLRAKISATIRAREFLGKAAHTLDTSFGLVQLAFFSTVPMQTVIAIYNVVDGLVNSDTPMILAINIFWSIGHIFKAVFLVECFHIISKTAKETETIVSKVLAVTNDEVIREDLKIFLELLKQCPTIFTCMDIRVIDRGVLGDLTGAVITLLVILVQYGE